MTNGYSWVTIDHDLMNHSHPREHESILLGQRSVHHQPQWWWRLHRFTRLRFTFNHQQQQGTSFHLSIFGTASHMSVGTLCPVCSHPKNEQNGNLALGMLSYPFVGCPSHGQTTINCYHQPLSTIINRPFLGCLMTQLAIFDSRRPSGRPSGLGTRMEPGMPGIMAMPPLPRRRWTVHEPSYN